MKNLLNHLFQHNYLTQEQAKSTLLEIGHGKHNLAQITAFLTVFAMRPINAAELRGFKDAMLELCLKVDLSDYQAMDIVGTGGDEKNSFNISTTTAFVVAGSGINVTKHGNYGVSSNCGSANVLEYLGVKFSNQKDHLCKMLDKTGFCMLHAPLFHPAMKFVAPIRKELQIKTFFNMLGPMINPSFPKKQLLGVYDLELGRLYSYAYQDSKIDYVIIHSLDGYDEVSLTSSTKVYNKDGEKLLTPQDFGFKTIDAKEIKAGDSIKENANLLLAILNNKSSEAKKNVVLANAGLAIQCAKNIPLLKAIALARESLESGKALNVLKKIIDLKI